MAKTSVTARDKKRERMVVQYAAKRAELKKAGDWKALDELPKNSSRVRLRVVERSPRLAPRAK